MKKSKINIVLACFLIFGMLMALSGFTGAAGKLSAATNNFFGVPSLSLAGSGNGIFGNDIIGNLADTNDANAQSISYFTCNQAGTITDIGAYIEGQGSGYAQTALYDGNGNLLRESNIININWGMNWVDFPLSSAYTTVAGQTYGLALLGEVPIDVALVQSIGSRIGGPGYENFASGFTNPFGVVWFNDPTGGMSIYASGTISAPSPTPSPTLHPTVSPTASPSPTPIPQFTLTVGVSGQGTINPATGTYSYNVNTQVPISASASNGYSFSYWLFGDGSKGYVASTTLTMTQSQSALAVFTQNAVPTPTPIPQVTLSMGVSGQGSVNPSVGSHNYDLNSQVTISANPSSGYTFSYWLFNDATTNTNPSMSLTMSQSRSALAVFAAIPQATATPAPGATPAPTAQPTSQPTPLPTSTPSPTTQPTATQIPTPLPIGNSPTPTGNEETKETPYINVNELFTTLGLSVIAIDVLGFALNNGLLGKKH